MFMALKYKHGILGNVYEICVVYMYVFFLHKFAELHITRCEHYAVKGFMLLSFSVSACIVQRDNIKQKKINKNCTHTSTQKESTLQEL